MQTASFIQDLAVIMLISGVVTVLFHRFKQPVVLGYIVVGVIIGPYTPPYPLVHDDNTIRVLAELGVVFLMFSLGLEFSLRKLRRVGATALVAALAEIILMIWIGYEIGRFFGWRTMDSLFLGAMLAISSTTIIAKALEDLGMKRERFAQFIYGILIVEDILAIAIIALLSGIAVTGSVNVAEVAATLGNLILFMVVSLVAGILLIPRLLRYVARFNSNEMLLVSVLGLCFGFCLLVLELGYSIVLGAFLIGAVMAESPQLRTIERLIEPIRDMFSAIFFVTVGLLLDPRILLEYAGPITVITIAVILGKIMTCSAGTFIAGHDGRTSLRVGMGLAQIGEFSFIIASLGMALNVTSKFLYPIAVAVSVITTFLAPYLIKAADPLSIWVARIMPKGVSQFFHLYTDWLESIQPQGDRAVLAAIIRKIVLQVFVNLCVAGAIFLGGAYFINSIDWHLPSWLSDIRIQKTVVWGSALVLSLPFLIAAYRKLKALSMLLAEMSVKAESAGQYTQTVRRVIAEAIPAAAVVGIILLLSALSASILPPTDMLILLLVVASILAALLWQRFVKLHARLQIALMETLNKDKDDH